MESHWYSLFLHGTDIRSGLTSHLQKQSSTAVVLHPDEAGIAAFVSHPHLFQQERGVAQAQLRGEQAGAVHERLSLVHQLVASLHVTVHAALGVCQLPKDRQIRQVEAGVGAEGAVEGGVPAVQRHHWLLRNHHLHQG